MAVITRKDEKVKSVVESLGKGFSENNFIQKFKEMYEKDWKKIGANYNKHLRKAKTGKPIPMPNPEQYLINALKVWSKKNFQD